MIVRDVFYAVLLWVLHSLYSVYELVVREWQSRKRRRKDDHSVLNSIRQLANIPKHIAFVISPEEHEKKVLVDKLAMLANCCLVLNVQNITIYDEHGELKGLKHNIERRLSSIESKEETNMNGINVKNGFTKPYFGIDNGTHSSTIRFLSASDGKQSIVEISRNLTKNLPAEASVGSLTVEQFDKLIKIDLNVPEPELVVLIGSTPCLFNFLPWQIRLSEIVPLPRRKDSLSISEDIVLQDLLTVLEKYNHCEQRFGK